MDTANWDSDTMMRKTESTKFKIYPRAKFNKSLQGGEILRTGIWQYRGEYKASQVARYKASQVVLYKAHHHIIWTREILIGEKICNKVGFNAWGRYALHLYKLHHSKIWEKFEKLEKFENFLKIG